MSSSCRKKKKAADVSKDLTRCIDFATYSLEVSCVNWCILSVCSTSTQTSPSGDQETMEEEGGEEGGEGGEEEESENDPSPPGTADSSGNSNSEE